MAGTEHTRDLWRPIETLDLADERTPVLLLRRNKYDGGFHIVQASAFEGYLYPDHMEIVFDWKDRIEDALYWRPVIPLPPMLELCATVPAITLKERQIDS